MLSAQKMLFLAEKGPDQIKVCTYLYLSENYVITFSLKTENLRTSQQNKQKFLTKVEEEEIEENENGKKLI